MDLEPDLQSSHLLFLGAANWSKIGWSAMLRKPIGSCIMQIPKTEIWYNHKSVEAKSIQKNGRKRVNNMFQRMSTVSVCITVMRRILSVWRIPALDGVRILLPWMITDFSHEVSPTIIRRIWFSYSDISITFRVCFNLQKISLPLSKLFQIAQRIRTHTRSLSCCFFRMLFYLLEIICINIINYNLQFCFPYKFY